VNTKELKIRYENRVRFWYKKFIELSDITDKLQAGLERQKEIIEKVACQNVQVIKELEALKEEQTEMCFDNISLEKQ